MLMLTKLNLPANDGLSISTIFPLPIPVSSVYALNEDEPELLTKPANIVHRFK